MKLDLLYYDDPHLRERCEEVTEFTPELKELATAMIDFMDHKVPAIGLAACQVGRSERMFVCRSYIEGADGRWRVSEPFVYVNPKITFHSKEMIDDDEGCISIPGIRANVMRPAAIRIEAQDLEGKRFEQEIMGYNARIRMHENDHLNGVLFIDRLPNHVKKRIAPKLKALAAQRKTK